VAVVRVGAACREDIIFLSGSCKSRSGLPDGQAIKVAVDRVVLRNSPFFGGLNETCFTVWFTRKTPAFRSSADA